MRYLCYLLDHVTSLDTNTFMYIVSDLPEDKILCAIYQEFGVGYVSSIYTKFVALRNDCKFSYFLLMYHFRSIYQQQCLSSHVHLSLVI
jgi:hypothetical protein